MLKYTNYDIVFQEIPDQVTLAVNLSRCPNRCLGCHSPHLQQDIGEELTEQTLDSLLGRYGDSATCLCLMGGDDDPASVAGLLTHLRIHYPSLQTAWYSGRMELPENFPVGVLDYVKLGPYVEAAGSLRSPNTNQRLYRMEADGGRTDLTYRFRQSDAR